MHKAVGKYRDIHTGRSMSYVVQKIWTSVAVPVKQELGYNCIICGLSYSFKSIVTLVIHNKRASLNMA